MSTVRSRSWCFNLSADNKEFATTGPWTPLAIDWAGVSPPVTFVIAGLDKRRKDDDDDDDGKLEQLWQGYLEFVNPVRHDSVKKVLHSESVHVEVSIENHQLTKNVSPKSRQNYNFCVSIYFCFTATERDQTASSRALQEIFGVYQRYVGGRETVLQGKCTASSA